MRTCKPAALISLVAVNMTACVPLDGSHIDATAICSAEVSCSVEDFQSITIASLRTNGTKLVVDCPATRDLNEHYRSECRDSIEAAVKKLGKWPDELVPPRTSEVTYQEHEFCADTFTSGQEAVDCGLHHISAEIPLHWQDTR